MTRLENDFTNSVVLDKEPIFQNFSPSSPSCAFKFLKQFQKSIIIANNLHWGKNFHKFFASVFQKPVSDYTVPNDSPDSDIKLSEVDVSPSVVSSSSKFVKNTCSVGCILAFVYKCCKSLLSSLASFLFLIIINTCVWPAAWKCGFVTPILKSGFPNDITNYRPISIFNPLGLCFEKILFDHIYPKIRKHLSNTKHGFRQQRSTVT